MSSYAEHLRDHPLHEQLAQLESSVSAISEEHLELYEGDFRRVVERISLLVGFTRGILSASDPMLVPVQSLNALNGNAEQIGSLLGRIEEGPQVNQEIDDQISAFLVSALPLAAASDLLSDRATVTDGAFSSSLQRRIERVEEESGSLEARLSELNAHIDSAKTSLDEALSERSTSLEESMRQLETSVNAEKERLDQLIPGFEKTFQEQQEEQRRTSQELVEATRTEFEVISQSLSEGASKTEESLRTEANALLQEIQARKAEVEDLYQVIADTGTAGAFSMEAEAQKQIADRWRIAAVVFSVLLGVIAVGSVVASFIDAADSSSAGTIAAKITATVVLAGIAAYAGRQSGAHRQREEEAKSLELDLVAAGPFLKQLEKAEQDEFKRAYAERAFVGRKREESSTSFRLGKSGDTRLVSIDDVLNLARQLNRE